MFDSNFLAVFSLTAVALAAPSGASATTYVSETRSIFTGGVTRSYVLAYPSPSAAGTALPLVLAYHGDGGTGAGFRNSIALEAQAADGAIFVYPDIAGNIFDPETDAGRAAEQVFVQDVVAAMQTEFGTARGRVFLEGFSRGAYMVNAVGCRLGPNLVRAIVANDGSITPASDFTYTGTGGISCPMPPSMIIWGENAMTSPYSDGLAYRDILRATQNCSANSTPGPVTSCVEYTSCKRTVAWCSIAGLGDGLWSDQAHATWTFFDDFLFANDFD